MNLIKSLYRHGDAMYIIIKKKPVSGFARKIGDEPDMDYVKLYMEWVGADHVLRSETHFIFCETIQEAKIIEDEHDTDNAD